MIYSHTNCLLSVTNMYYLPSFLGKMLVFDDSFEHEVVHNSNSTRIGLNNIFFKKELTKYMSIFFQCLSSISLIQNYQRRRKTGIMTILLQRTMVQRMDHLIPWKVNLIFMMNYKLIIGIFVFERLNIIKIEGLFCMPNLN